MIVEFATQLEQLPLAQYIAESDWGFPILEIIHVLAITLVVGSIAIVDLRLLGVGATKQPASKIISAVLPWTWSMFAVALSAGVLLFSSKAVAYLDNPFFFPKMICIGLAGINMLAFHLFTQKSIAEWDIKTPPLPAKIAGGLSLCLWISVIALGRWMGFA